MKKGSVALVGVAFVGILISLIALLWEYIVLTIAILGMLALFVGVTYVLIKEKSKNKFAPKTNNLLKKKRMDRVAEHSKMFMALSELNKEFNFEKLYDNSFGLKCDSLQKYRKTDERVCLYNIIKEKSDYFRQEIEKSEINTILWNNYTEEYVKIRKILLTEKEIKEIKNRKMRVKTFIELEKELYELKKSREPKCRVLASMEITYTSPKGRNFYKKNCTMTQEEIKRIIFEENHVGNKIRSTK